LSGSPCNWLSHEDQVALLRQSECPIAQVAHLVARTALQSSKQPSVACLKTNAVAVTESGDFVKAQVLGIMKGDGVRQRERARRLSGR